MNLPHNIIYVRDMFSLPSKECWPFRSQCVYITSEQPAIHWQSMHFWSSDILYHNHTFFGRSSNNWLQECISLSALMAPLTAIEQGFGSACWLIHHLSESPFLSVRVAGRSSWAAMLSVSWRALHFSSSTGMSGAAPQEGSCSDLAGSWGSRVCAPDSQHK